MHDVFSSPSLTSQNDLIPAAPSPATSAAHILLIYMYIMHTFVEIQQNISS